MILNKHYETDVKYVLGQSHIVLRMLGIWPSTDRQPNTIEKIANISLVIISYLLVQCDFVPGILYYVVLDGEWREKLKFMPPVLFSFMAIAKYSNLLIYKYDVRNCLWHIKEDWRTVAIGDAREVMLSKANIGRRLFILCCTFMYCGGVSYNTVVPLSRGSTIIDENTTIRPLSCAGYYIFFDPQNSPAYELVFLQQILCGFVMYTITVTICGLAAVFAIHACAQMEILMRLMEGLTDDSEFEQRNVSAKLAIVIERQIRIQNFLQLVENTLRYSSLVEIVGCSVIICLVGYSIIVEWEDRNLPALSSYLVSLVSVLINIFILCYIGEYITTQICFKIDKYHFTINTYLLSLAHVIFTIVYVLRQADEVSLTIRTLDWYRLPTNVARDMTLVTAVSNLPPRFTAGKFIELSFRTFGDVIKTAVIYLNMLRQFTE